MANKREKAKTEVNSEVKWKFIYKVSEQVGSGGGGGRPICGTESFSPWPVPHERNYTAPWRKKNTRKRVEEERERLRFLEFFSRGGVRNRYRALKKKQKRMRVVAENMR
jgi:hypothetical protein